jgi:branched-chain amino acid transport system permease protein
VALLWAAVICAVVGAVIALPALRLDGIYLALGTAAFAVALDKWIFGLPKFTWFGHEIYLFKGGTLNFKRFDLAGLSVKSDRAYFIFGAVLFALLSLVVVAIRRGEFGRRLLALKDSPAAYATLGMNQRVTTIGVFALSAAMAGIGGGIFGAAVKTTSADQFVFMSGLSILMMMVISGLTSPGAAVLSGVILGTPLMTNLFPDWAQLTTVLIGLNGIALGKNPNGMIPSQLRPHWNPALRYPQVIAAGSGFVVLLYVFREMDLIGNYVMLLGFALALIAVSAVAKGFEARKVTAKEPAEFSAPPERLGLDVPFTPSDIDALDRRLDLQGVGRHG